MKSKLLLVLLAGLMFMCNHEDEQGIPIKGHVSFGVSSTSSGAGRTRAEALDEALITIEGTSGQVIYDGSIKLTTFGDRYISEQLALGTGDYKLTKFILLGSGKAKYASPLVGSPMAHLVKRPLPIEFSIQHNAVTTLLPEVVAIEKTSPGEFGYVEFGFEVVSEAPADVYVVGFGRTTKNGKSVAKLWKNGSETDLTDGSLSAAAHKVIVVGDDVYVVGGEGRKAVMWKNGVPTYLTDGIDNARAYDIVVSGTNVYICGTITRQQGLFEYKQAVYWKNNELVPLSAMSVNHFSALAIALKGNDLYVIGTGSTGPYHQAGTKTFGTYWKNGQEFPLLHQSTSEVGVDLGVLGNEVVLLTNTTTGTAQHPIAYHPWLTVNGENAENENGIGISMRASDLEIAGDEVYVVGASFPGSGKAHLMVHSDLHIISAMIQLLPGDGAPNRDTDAFGLTTHGSDIYVCGKEWSPERAVYWKVKKPIEGMPMPAPELVYLSNPATTPVAYAYSIFVKEK